MDCQKEWPAQWLYYLCEGIEKYDFSNGSLYNILSNEYHLELYHANESIEAIVINKKNAALLNCKPGIAGYKIIRLSNLQSGFIYEYTTSITVPTAVYSNWICIIIQTEIKIIWISRDSWMSNLKFKTFHPLYMPLVSSGLLKQIGTKGESSHFFSLAVPKQSITYIQTSF